MAECRDRPRHRRRVGQGQSSHPPSQIINATANLSLRTIVVIAATRQGYLERFDLASIVAALAVGAFAWAPGPLQVGNLRWLSVRHAVNRRRFEGVGLNSVDLPTFRQCRSSRPLEMPQQLGAAPIRDKRLSRLACCGLMRLLALPFVIEPLGGAAFRDRG
jgi:hypothetical protein